MWQKIQNGLLLYFEIGRTEGRGRRWPACRHSVEITSPLFGLLPFHVPQHHIPDGGALLSGNTGIPLPCMTTSERSRTFLVNVYGWCQLPPGTDTVGVRSLPNPCQSCGTSDSHGALSLPAGHGVLYMGCVHCPSIHKDPSAIANSLPC